MSWSLNNEESLWIETTDLYNQGMYHHSTWIAVPESFYPGPDGFWDCDERGFDEVEAAISGTVLIAQSTQSLWEQQRYGPNGEGVVVKIPPRHKLVAVNHMLNVSNREITTGVTMNLHLVHPSLVKTVLVPFRLLYGDLTIPPTLPGALEPTQSDFVAECDIRSVFEGNGETMDTKVHFLLPHTHDLGRRFYVDIVGGPRDGERIVDLDGFNAQGNGQSFFPSVDLSDADGLRMTCGFVNETSEEIGWGIGDQEMCELLGMADSSLLFDLRVNQGASVGVDANGVEQFTGGCSGVAFPPNSGQKLPTEQELARALYLPELPPQDVDLPEVPECQDVDITVAGEQPATLSSVQENLFVSCTWSACHAGANAAADLNLESTDLHGQLVGIDSRSDPGVPLVDPGNPDNSMLYRRISQCEPTTSGGANLGHMPWGSPVLLEDALVNKVRAWIEAGAPND